MVLLHFCVPGVILQGTQLYDPKAGGWRDLGMLDVMQVRPKISPGNYILKQVDLLYSHFDCSH